MRLMFIALSLLLVAPAGAYASNVRPDGDHELILPYYARISAADSVFFPLKFFMMKSASFSSR